VRGAVAGGGGLGCVLLVSNLNETDTEPDHLFILFGVYGDVQVMTAMLVRSAMALFDYSFT
jgi:hypothetical protein